MVKYTILVVLTILGSDAAKQGSSFNKTKSRENHGKIFSLFSIVQFPNSGCASSSTSFPNGTCLTTSECSSKGGSAQGGCAAGFGVCCIFTTSTTGSTISTNCSYITNPGYPSDFTTSVATQTFTIAKCSTDVCRIRLDYEEFVLTAPDIAVITTDGQCIIDRLTFTTTSQTTESTVAGAGIQVTTFGNYPYICGTNTGFHSYLDLGCTDGDTAKLSFTLGDTTNNKYKIKVTQLSCNDMCVAAQDGCFQYYTGVTGNIKSYNFNDASNIHLASQNYQNCIRQEEGYCCINYLAETFDLPILAGVDCAAVTLANLCTQALSCSIDFVMIPGAQNPAAAGFATANSVSTTNSRFCGSALVPGGYQDAVVAPNIITTCETPFTLGFTTEKTSNEGALAGVNKGFSISYTQIAC